MIIKVLCENTAKSEAFACEHGLSLYIETNGRRLLFDMGQTDVFFKNAKTMSVNLADVDTAILSHGHYDHSGGMGLFLKENDKASVYMSGYAFGEHYNAEDKFIGVDKSLKGNERLKAVFEKTSLGDGLTLYTAKDTCLSYPPKPYGLSRLEGDKKLPDDFRHEIYLLIEESGKRVLISGCSHRGVVGLAEFFKPDVLVGGFHFMKLSPQSEELYEAGQKLCALDTRYYTGHCTGAEQFETLKAVMDKKLYYISSGDVVTI